MTHNNVTDSGGGKPPTEPRFGSYRATYRSDPQDTAQTPRRLPQERKYSSYVPSPGMSENKRKSSRSPEGSNVHRKVSRGAPSSNNESTDPRRRTVRPNASVQSPINTDGSAYQDAASSRSTPQPQVAGPRTAVMVAAPSAVATAGTEDAVLKKPLQEALAKLMSHMTAESSLRTSYDLAKRQLEIATAEYKNMQGHFQKYPAIQERTTHNKSKATEKVAELSQQLKEEETQGKLATSLCEALWTISNSAGANSRLHEPQGDVVSREDYDRLQDSFQKQQDLISQHQDRFDKQASMIERLEQTVMGISETAVQAKAQAILKDQNTTRDLTALKTWVQNVESSGQISEDNMQSLKATVLRHTTDIANLRAGLAQHKSDFATEKETLRSSIKSASSEKSGTNDGLSRVERQMSTIKSDLGAVKEKVRTISDDVFEPGKASIVRRLKGYDQTINNLAIKVEETGLGQKAIDPIRIEEHEKYLTSLSREIRDVREGAKLETSNNASAATVPASMPHDFDLQVFKEEVVEDATALIEATARDLDNQMELIAALQERLDSLEKLVQHHADRARELAESNNNEHDSINTVCTSTIGDVATLMRKIDPLQGDITSLSASVKSLQKRPSPAPMNGPLADVRDFRPLLLASPRSPNTRTSITPAPVQANGTHPASAMVAPQSMFNGTMTVPSNAGMPASQELAALWNSITSLRVRYDNLTTEEVVRAMVDQTSKMYPAAKEFQAAVKVLQAVDKGLDDRLTSLAKEASSAREFVIKVHGEFKKFASSQQVTNTRVNEDLQKLRSDNAIAVRATTRIGETVAQEITKAKEQVNQAVDMQNNAIVRIESEVKEQVKEQVDQAVDVQNDAIVRIKSEVQALAEKAFN